MLTVVYNKTRTIWIFLATYKQSPVRMFQFIRTTLNNKTIHEDVQYLMRMVPWQNYRVLLNFLLNKSELPCTQLVEMPNRQMDIMNNTTEEYTT